MNKFFTFLKSTVEQPQSQRGRYFDLTIQCLILVSIVSFSLETVPGYADRAGKIFNMIEVVSVAVFTVEYLTRILVADNKLKFMFSVYGIIDLLAILPAYLGLGVDLRSLRALRLLRLFRVLKLVRYSRALRRFHLALRMVKEELILFLTVAGIVLYLSAVGIYFFENEAQPEKFRSVPESLWWAIVTLTTVGYGDSYPITTGGRVFTFFVLVVGLGIVAVPSGLFAAALTNARELEPDSEQEVQADLKAVRQDHV